jgi:hypothetical protein
MGLAFGAIFGITFGTIALVTFGLLGLPLVFLFTLAGIGVGDRL